MRTSGHRYWWNQIRNRRRSRGRQIKKFANGKSSLQHYFQQRLAHIKLLWFEPSAHTHGRWRFKLESLGCTCTPWFGALEISGSMASSYVVHVLCLDNLSLCIWKILALLNCASIQKFKICSWMLQTRGYTKIDILETKNTFCLNIL